MRWKGLVLASSEFPLLFSVQSLARAIGLSPKSVYNDLDSIRRGASPREKLPPFFYREGSNRPIFVDVEKWIEAQLQRQQNLLARTSTTTSAVPQHQAAAAKKRGRKTNKEKAALERGGAV